MNGLLYHFQKLSSDSSFGLILPASYGDLDSFQLDLDYTLRSHTWAVFALWRSSDLGL